MYFLITVRVISTNSITQLSPKHCIMAVIHFSSIEYRCPGYTYNKIVRMSRGLITLTDGHSIFILDLVIPAVNSFTSKVHMLMRISI